MIPIIEVPLVLCSVLLRKFIDSRFRSLPLAVASTTTIPTTVPAALLLSGSLACLYYQLQQGTLVNIGLGKRISSMIRNSRHTIQRRVKNNSWFLRNVNSCRRKCAAAVCKIIQPKDSLAQIRDETGTMETGTCVENLYRNKSFDSKHSTEDLRVRRSKRRGRRKKVFSDSHKPLTGNLDKLLPKELQEECIRDEIRENIKDGRNLKRRLRSHNPERESEPKKLSERFKKHQKIQKIVSKTRSGRVYAYRL